MTDTVSALTILAGALLFALPDEAGITRRIALHPPGHYAIDERSTVSSLMVGPPDYSVFLAAPTRDDALARLRFPHLGSWDARYLGYENLWMLLSHYPHECLNGGVGRRIALPGLAEQGRRLTVQRGLTEDLIHPVTAAGPDASSCLELMRTWMLDRADIAWPGDAGDPALKHTPFWVVRDLDIEITLRHVEVPEGDARREIAPAWWTVTRSWPTRDRPEPYRQTRWFQDSPGQRPWAVNAFLGLAAGAGPHWT